MVFNWDVAFHASRIEFVSAGNTVMRIIKFIFFLDVKFELKMMSMAHAEDGEHLDNMKL